ncbi:hypothetical protein [Streptomyces sp. NPDC093261]|uniref:hypothetical protein n=1 Tax=Streptomyces sp. NPDC093261 TaxID=3366037 RepID=UPI0038199D19
MTVTRNPDRRERLDAEIRLPNWNVDGRVLSVLVNVNLDPIRVPPETMNNRYRKLADKAKALCRSKTGRGP